MHKFSKTFFYTFTVFFALLAAGTVIAWSGPLNSSPTCYSGNPGCDAPLNVSGTAQIKNGALWVNGFANGGSTYFVGNVGLGTASPGAKLDVNGSIRIPDDTSIGKLQIGSNGSYLSRQSSDGSTILQTGQAALLLNPAGGNYVGIGTASPGQKLDVNGYVRVDSVNGEGGTIQMMGNNGTNMYLENYNGTFRLVNSPWTAGIFNVDQSGNTTISGTLTASGQPVCLANGTNCPTAANLSNYVQYNTYGPNNTYYGTNGDMYLPYLGNWLSQNLNQSVTTAASPTFAGLTIGTGGITRSAHAAGYLVGRY